MSDSCHDETEEDVEESNPPDLNAGECCVSIVQYCMHACVCVYIYIIIYILSSTHTCVCMLDDAPLINGACIQLSCLVCLFFVL